MSLGSDLDFLVFADPFFQFCRGIFVNHFVENKKIEI